MEKIVPLKKFIISTDCPTGPKEILKNGKYGYLTKIGDHNNISKKIKFGLNNKSQFLNLILPPFIAICSLIIFSSSFIYFYSPFENIEKKEQINPE